LPDTAQRKANKRKALNRKIRYVDKYPKLKRRIIKLLKNGWSPDLIAGRLKRENKSYLNQESIYQFIAEHFYLALLGHYHIGATHL